MPGSPALNPSSPDERAIWAGLAAAVVLVAVWQAQVLEPALGRAGAAVTVAGALGALALLGAGSRVRRDALRRVLAASLVDPRRAHALTVLVLLGAIKIYLLPGHRLLQGDGACHTTTTWLVAESLRAGVAPTWSNAWALGFPFLQFYPPGFAWLSGLLALATSPEGGVRLVLAGAHLASGLGAFALARRLTDRPGAWIAAAIGYALTPWHLFQVFHWNRFPAALVWGLLPWVLRALEGRPGAGRTVRRTAVGLAAVGLVHHGYALFVAAFSVLWVGMRALEERRTVAVGLRVGGLAASAAIAALLSGFFVFPYLLEADLVFRLPGVGGIAWEFDQPTVASVLLPARRPFGHSGYLGLSLVVPGLVGLIAWSLRGGRGRLAAPRSASSGPTSSPWRRSCPSTTGSPSRGRSSTGAAT